MPQSPIQVQNVESLNIAYNIAAATVVKATGGRLAYATVISAGTTPGTVNNVATTAGAAIDNQVASLPNTVGAVVTLNCPMSAGIVVVPGSGQVVSVGYI